MVDEKFKVRHACIEDVKRQSQAFQYVQSEIRDSSGNQGFLDEEEKCSSAGHRAR